MIDYRTEIAPKMLGLWPEFFAGVGLDVGVMRGQNSKNGPCPLCGGTDRAHFREEDGRLALYCRACSDGGMWSPEDVYMQVTGRTFGQFVQDAANFVSFVPTEVFSAKVAERQALKEPRYCKSMSNAECEALLAITDDGIEKLPVFKRISGKLVMCNVAGLRGGEFIGFATGKYSSLGFCIIGEGSSNVVTHDYKMAKWYADKFSCRVIWALNPFNLREMLRVATAPVKVVMAWDFNALSEVEKGNPDQEVEVIDMVTGLRAAVDSVEKILDNNQ